MIYVDGDACPVKDIIIRLAKEFHCDVVIYIDTAHVYNSSYAKIITVSKGADSVDYMILKVIKENDILVSADYALCAMALSKKSKPILPSGILITEHNINTLLMNRYISKKARDMNLHIKGPKKRTQKDNLNFEASLRKLLEDTL